MKEADWLWTGIQVLSVVGSVVAVILSVVRRKESARVEIDGEVAVAGRPPEYVTAATCEKVHEAFTRRIATIASDAAAGDAKLDGDIRRLGEKLDEFRTALQAEGSRRASNIHSRVDKLSGLVERLDERTETTNASVVEVSRKVDILLSRKPNS